MSRRSIQDCRAIVTGASSGIGSELALELARRRDDDPILVKSATVPEIVPQTNSGYRFAHPDLRPALKSALKR